MEPEVSPPLKLPQCGALCTKGHIGLRAEIIFYVPLFFQEYQILPKVGHLHYPVVFELNTGLG